MAELSIAIADDNRQTLNLLGEILEKEELLAALRRELAKLEALDRIILQMAMNGLSEASIGRKVGLSQKGVNKRKHRLLEQLREQLKDYR